jgi:hypothetical protein
MSGDLPARISFDPSRTPARIYRDHNTLRAKSFGGLRDELRARYRGCVDPDLVSTCAQQSINIVDGTHTPANGQRDEYFLGRSPHNIQGCFTIAAAGCDVEEYEFIGSLQVVRASELDRVACIAQINEIDTFDNAPSIHIEAGNHTNSDGHGLQPRSPRAATPLRTTASVGAGSTAGSAWSSIRVQILT